MKHLFSIILGFLLFSCSTSKKENFTLPAIINNGTEINYQISGNGDTTLLFVHGWCINQSYWKDQVDYFDDHYKVVTLDLPGHGLSGKNREEWTIEAFGDDVVMIIDALELKNVVLIGHSMGGNIILEVANESQQNVIGFVGVDNFKDLGAEYTDDQAEELVEFITMIREDYQGVAGGFAEGMLFHESTNQEIKNQVMNDVLNANPEIAVPILASLMKVNVKERGLMQQLSLKVYLINSEATPTNIAQLEKYCTQSYEIHSIGLTGHYPMVEEPEKFNQILSDILMEL